MNAYNTNNNQMQMQLCNMIPSRYINIVFIYLHLALWRQHNADVAQDEGEFDASDLEKQQSLKVKPYSFIRFSSLNNKWIY